MHLSFVEHETSFNYMVAFRAYIEKHDAPQALFSDRFSVFRSPNPDKNGEYNPTQFSLACVSMGIQVICAKTPQAKGRVERANRTLQDRLIKELRLRNISTVRDAMAFLPEYIAAHNEPFARPPTLPTDAHAQLPREMLDKLLVFTSPWKIFKDLSASFNRAKFIIERTEENERIVGKTATAVVDVHGEVRMFF